MNVTLTPLAVVTLVAMTGLTGVAYAQAPNASIAVSEVKAQMNADESALARERAQLSADQNALNADTRSGRMAAESPDVERVYNDGRYIRGERKDLAGDKTGSLQKNADAVALTHEVAQLKADQSALQADTQSGKMTAESPDAEQVYKDQRAIKGQEMAISSDKASLRADQKNNSR